MNFKAIIKKQSFIITLSIIVMGIILLGTSYALFFSRANSETQVVSSGTLSVSYMGSTITTVGGEDGNGNLVEIEPIEEGLVNNQVPYTIKVNNTGSLAMRYNIIIYTEDGNTLPHSYYAIKYKENGVYTNKVALTTLPKVDNNVTQLNSIRYKLKTEPFTVEPNQTNTHEIYVWIDEATADDSVANKIAKLKIKVEGEATDATPLPYEIVSGDLATVGSEVKIGTEEFYVIGQEDSTHVKLLSKWNLNVGNNTQPGEQGIQNSKALGYNRDSSTYVNYYYPATVAFSSTNYWHDESVLKPAYGSSYPAYVYDSNASIKTYVDTYVTYLNNQGVNVTGRLIKQEELVSLGCNASTNYCDSNEAHGGTAPSWVYQTTYWSGSATGSNGLVWFVSSGGSLGGSFFYDRYDYDSSYGVRPVIILEI